MTRAVNDAIAVNLRRLRAGRSMSAVELARRAGVSRATLSQLEAGGGNPTLETLYSLANVLEASLADLLADQATETPARVTRAGTGAHVRGRSVRAWLVDRIGGPAPVEVYDFHVDGHDAQVSDPHPRGTWEHLHLYEGHVRVGAVAAPLELRAGDYAAYPADEPHLYESLGEGAARGLLLITRT